MSLLDKLLFWRKKTDENTYVIDGCFPMESQPADLGASEELTSRPGESHQGNDAQR